MQFHHYFCWLIVVLCLATVAFGQAPTTPRDHPYPASPVIKGLTIDPDRQSIGDGDNWPITWADDGEQYTVYCDGKGFGGGSGEGSMSLAKITGSPPDIQGQNIVSPSGHKTGGGESGRKGSGLLMVDRVLYMWVRNLNKDGTGSSLAWSKDRAQTWTWASWSFPEIGYHPWGPWTTVTQIEGWGGQENRFQPRIPSKWISGDGKSFYLLYSCFPKGPYKFNVQRCTITLAP